MVELIEGYLKKKELAWSEKTVVSTRGTLRKVAPYLTGDARVLWDYLVTVQQGYSRVTTWGRVCGFWDFIKSSEENPYRIFRTENKRLFKDQYKRRPAKESMEEAKERVDCLEDPAIRRKALEILYSGMRWGESLTLKEGVVTGKTGERQVFVPKVEGPEYTGSYRTFFRALSDIGLKPHTLRKIALTECVNKGANVFELKEIAGWKSLAAATSYIGIRPERIEAIMESIREQGGKSNDRGRTSKRVPTDD